MDSQETIRALTTIGAVILGFLLGQISEWIKTKKAVSNKIRSVRKLINLEISQNIKKVTDYWDKVMGSYEEGVDEDNQFRYVQLAEAAVKNPFPILSRESWIANLNEITSAYSEEELEEIWNFQSDLEHLGFLYAFFYEAINEKKDTRHFYNATHSSSAMGMIISSLGFADSVQDHVPEFKKVIERIIKFEISV